MAIELEYLEEKDRTARVERALKALKDRGIIEDFTRYFFDGDWRVNITYQGSTRGYWLSDAETFLNELTK